MPSIKSKNPALLFLILLFCASSFVQAQTLDSISGTPDFMGYGSNSVLCNLTLYSGATSGSQPSSQPTGFCESIENDQFICFQTANTTEVIFEFALSSCAGNGSGIEVGVVDQNGNSVGDCIIVDDPLAEEHLELNGLDPFTTYCLRIDGIQGSECDFVFTPVSGIASDPPSRPNRPTADAPPYCYGDTIGVDIERIPNASGYLWETFTNNSLFGQHYLDANGNRITGMTRDTILQLVLPSFDITMAPGTCDTLYSYVSAVNGCGVSDPSPELAIVLCANPIDTLVFTTCGQDSVEYPSGSGNYYYENGGEYQTAPAQNGSCEDVIAILVEEGQGVGITTEIDTTICEFPVILEGDTISNEGIYSYYFSSTTSTCDSVVSYTVRSPSAQGAALNNPYCTDELIRVGNTPWDNNFTYTWTDPQGNLAGATPNDYLNQFEIPGVYILTISHLGCESILEVIVEPQPEFEYSVGNDLLTINTAGAADSIAFYINGGFEAGHNSTIVYQGLSNLPDSISLTVCAFTVCGSFCDNLVIDSTLSNRQTSPLSKLNVWPNPSSGIFNIQTKESAEQLLEVYSIVGEVVFSTRMRSGAQVDLVHLPPGAYMLLLKDVETRVPIARSRIIKN